MTTPLITGNPSGASRIRIDGFLRGVLSILFASGDGQAVLRRPSLRFPGSPPLGGFGIPANFQRRLGRIVLRGVACLALAAVALMLGSCGGSSTNLNPTPVISDIFPDSTTALGLADCTSGPTFMLAIQGIGFFSNSSMDQSTVLWNNSPRATTFDSVTDQLDVTITACDIESPGNAQVSVSNPAPGGGLSGSVTFTINPIDNAQPAITLLDPSSANAAGPGFSIALTGTNFIATSSVAFNGSPRATTFNPGTNQLTAAILSQDILCPGTAGVTVTNPAPGGGTSLGSPFQILPMNSQQPCILALSPASVPAGSAAFSLIVSGTNFNSSSIVNFNGSARTTTFDSSTGRLTAMIQASDVMNPANANITVTNTMPVASTSAPFTFTIN